MAFDRKSNGIGAQQLTRMLNFHFSPFFARILIGDGGVGKSCLMNRFVSNHFDENSFHTIGVEFLNKDIDIDGERYTLQVSTPRRLCANIFVDGDAYLVGVDSDIKRQISRIARDIQIIHEILAYLFCSFFLISLLLCVLFCWDSWLLFALCGLIQVLGHSWARTIQR